MKLVRVRVRIGVRSGLGQVYYFFTGVGAVRKRDRSPNLLCSFSLPIFLFSPHQLLPFLPVPRYSTSDPVRESRERCKLTQWV